MTDSGSRASRRLTGYSCLTACLAIASAIAVIIATQSAAGAATATVNLGTATPFGVLAGSTVTNTGPTVIFGDVGLSPGTAITGFPPGRLTGTEHVADGVAGGAQSDLTTAYNDAAGRSPSASVGPAIGAGQTLTPGVYNASSSLDLGGSLILNAQGNPDAVFIFQVGSTLVTDSASSVILTNGAQACNVFWQVGSSATLGTGSSFQGSILALTSISVTTGDTIVGRALARNGAVTLDDDTIRVPACASPTPTPTPTTTSPSPSPSPTTTRPHPSPSPTTTKPHPSPSPTTTKPHPSPSPTTTKPHPSPSPTTTKPHPSPSPTTTKPHPSPSPTTTKPHPSPSPTKPHPSPSPTKPGPAPIPSPVPPIVPVTG